MCITGISFRSSSLLLLSFLHNLAVNYSATEVRGTRVKSTVAGGGGKLETLFAR